MVLTISSSFYPYLDLCLAYPYLDRCPDPCHVPVYRAILICADDRGHDRDPCHDHGLGPCLCRDLCPVDLCLGDRDLGIVNENANDVCSSYERKILQLKRFVQNKIKIEQYILRYQDGDSRYPRVRNRCFKYMYILLYICTVLSLC